MLWITEGEVIYLHSCSVT